MFSNIKIILLSSLIINPENFKNVTLLWDGHDSTVEYNKPDIEYQKKWSYKLLYPTHIIHKDNYLSF